MPTVRSPSSFAARKMRIAISLRLAASSFWMFFGFVITGANPRSREILHFHTKRGVVTQEIFSRWKGQENLSRAEIPSEGGRYRLSADWRRRGFQLPQLCLDLVPLFRLPLGGIGSIRISEKFSSSARNSCVYFSTCAR